MPWFASKLCALALISASTLSVLPSATAQDFSAKPITLVVGFPAGGSNDLVARLIAPHLSEALKTSVIIDIKAGASGTIAAGSVVRSTPDGHTLLVSSLSPTVLTPQIMRKPPYDPRVDQHAWLYTRNYRRGPDVAQRQDIGRADRAGANARDHDVFGGRGWVSTLSY